MPPLRQLTESERAAWERAVEMAREQLPLPARSSLDYLDPVGIQDGEGNSGRILWIRVRAGAGSAAIRLAQSGTLRRALYEAFGEIIDPVPIREESP
ncbi:MAG: hypothetical protein QN160_09985 [Armatimonadota bacterium]|nr:hypothetical protein [Armatimonadota bacterium]MDR7574243.1 hypothetical protein [Armatimonadota bacterium]